MLHTLLIDTHSHNDYVGMHTFRNVTKISQQYYVLHDFTMSD